MEAFIYGITYSASNLVMPLLWFLLVVKVAGAYEYNYAYEYNLWVPMSIIRHL